MVSSAVSWFSEFSLLALALMCLSFKDEGCGCATISIQSCCSSNDQAVSASLLHRENLAASAAVPHLKAPLPEM